MDLHQLQNCDFFKGLSESDIASLLFSNPSAVRIYEEGDLVAHQGEVCDKLAVITEGSVYSMMSNSYGKELIVGDLTAPEILGYTYLFATNNTFSVDVIAKSHSKLYFIEKDRLVSLMHERPIFMQSFMRGVADRNLKVFKLIYNLNLNKLKQRVLNYLNEHQEITNVTELAKQLGVARPSLSRALAELRRDGLIKR
ncbi:MAG: Crp/Fnr family transcriptional regulator [Bacteroidaceae bacterium]|nr:Crp/Fnr family transcriptional regulator [Bacteroidaceae bacterium]